MSFKVDDHLNNRVNAYRISDYLDGTAGKAVRLTGDWLKMSKQSTDLVAKQICLGLQVTAASARDKRFSGANLAANFLVGELQYAVTELTEKNKRHFNGHLLSDDDWAGVVAFLVNEFIAATNAYLRSPVR